MIKPLKKGTYKMERKYTIGTYVLLLLLMIGAIVNTALLAVILGFDTFLVSDLITVTALILLVLSFAGILYRRKWGAGLAITKCCFDIILRLIYYTLGLIGSLLLIALILCLACKEYVHLGTYQQSVATMMEI